MKNYGVLKGAAIKYVRDNDDSPHSELLLDVKRTKYRVAVNVRSSRGPVHRRLIEYLIVHDFHHTALDHARNLPIGWNDLKDGVNDEAALDYIRSNLFRADELKPVVHLEPGPNICLQRTQQFYCVPLPAGHAGVRVKIVVKSRSDPVTFHLWNIKHTK